LRLRLAVTCGQRWLRLCGAFEFADVEFFHLEHGANGVGMFEEIGQARRGSFPFD